MSIESNVAARKAAESSSHKARHEAIYYIALGDETSRGDGFDAKTFWLAVAVAALDRAGVPKEEPAPVKIQAFPPMTDAEARAFGRKTIAFGRHQGATFNSVPLSYLNWLDESQWPNSLGLNRYLNSDYVQREHHGDGDDDD